MQTGIAVLGDHQIFRGYTLFLCKKHVEHIEQLDHLFRSAFLLEMSLVGNAVREVTKCSRVNLELLGNLHGHLHWHVFPRRHTDPIPTKPVWIQMTDLQRGQVIIGSEPSIRQMIEKLGEAIDRLVSEIPK